MTTGGLQLVPQGVGSRLAILLLAGCVSPGWAATVAPGTEVVSRALPCLDLRPAPDPAAPAARCLRPGRRMTLLESRQGWRRVRLPNGDEGWVAEDLVTAAGDADRELLRSIEDLEAQVRRSRFEANALRLEIKRLREQGRVEAEEAATAPAARVEIEAEAQRRIDDLTARLQAAEIFFAKSETDRRESEEELAALRRENEALRERVAAAEAAAELAGTPAAAATVTSSDETGALAAAEAGPASGASGGSVPEEASAAELVAVVQEWADAWSGQRIEDYLAFYAAAFEPADGLGRGAWEAQRRARLSRPSRIEVEVAFLELQSDRPDRAEIRFLQSYRSDAFRDVVTKTLVFVREEGVWKIAAERNE